MGPKALAQVLQPLKSIFSPADFPSVIRGLDRPDDAGAMKVADGRVLVMTADFFPPVVDDPYHYGAIAAANALSDVYAMGAEPAIAINLAAFPEDLDKDIVSMILKGGAEKVREAGAVIVGGHTTVDPEPKYGLAVVGFVDEAALFANEGAEPGDILALTKPIGAGILTTAHKREAVKADHLDKAIFSMARLNAGAVKILRKYATHVHAVTDVTGFSLGGHAHEMAHLSGVALHIEYDAIPLLEGAPEYAAAGFVTGGGARNKTHYGSWVDDNKRLGDTQEQLFYDPQTSGGLLCAIHPSIFDDMRRAFADEDEPIWKIGRVEDAAAGKIVIE